ncbi:hypothetical protein [Rhodopirellula halodulae]|nr:hypothetical protein [Rhodopirellula sp. JC737]
MARVGKVSESLLVYNDASRDIGWPEPGEVLGLYSFDCLAEI